MARVYRAGQAYVDVVPVFGNIQHDIAKQLRRSLKDAFGDKSVYDGLDKEVGRNIAEGIAGSEDEVRAATRKVMSGVQKETKKGATVATRDIRKSFTQEMNSGWYGNEVRKVTQQVEKALGKDFGKVLLKSSKKGMKTFKEEAGGLYRDLEVLRGAFTDGGVKDVEQIRRAYAHVHETLKKIEAEGTKAFSRQKSSSLANLKTAMGAMGGDNWSRIVGLKTDEEIAGEKKRLRELASAWDAAHREDKKREETRLRELAAAAKEQAKIRERDAKSQKAAYDRTLKSLKDYNSAVSREQERARQEEQKKAWAARVRRQAEASQMAKEMASTSFQESRTLSDVGTGGSSRQERLTQRRTRDLASYRAEVARTLSAVGRMNSTPLVIRVNSAQAEQAFEYVQRLASTDEQIDLDVELDEAQAEAELRKLEAWKEKADAALGELDLEIDLEDEHAQAELDALKVELAAIKDVKVGVDPEINRQALAEVQARVRELTQHEKKVINLDVELDDAQKSILALETALDSIRDKRVGIDITEREAIAQIATIRSLLEAIPDEKRTEYKVDFDKSVFDVFSKNTEEAETKMRRLSRSIKNANISLSESTQAFRIFSPMLAGVAVAGAPVVSTLGAVAGGLGGLVAIAPGAIGGISAVALAFGGLEDSTKKYTDAQEALDAQRAGETLTKAQQDAITAWEQEADVVGEATANWIEYTDQLGDSFKEIQRGAREGLFPGLQESISMVMDTYAGPFTEFLEDTGSLLGDISTQWAKGLTSTAAQEWFGRVEGDVDDFAVAFGEMVTNVVSGLGHIVDVFRPTAHDIMDGLVDMTSGFNDWAASLADNPKFDEFMSAFRSILPMVGEIASEIGELFVNLVIAVEPFSEAILDAVTGALEFVNAMDPQVLGAILGAVGGLTAGLMLLSGVMAGIGTLTTVLGALSGSLLTQVAAGLAGFIVVNSTALGAMSMTEGQAGTLGKVSESLGGALSQVADLGRTAWEVFVDLFDAISPLIPVVVDLAADVLSLAAILGGAFLGALEPVIKLIGLVVDGFTALPDGMQETILVLGLLAGTFGKIQTGFSAVVGVFDTLRIKTWDAQQSVVGFGTRMTENGQKVKTYSEGMERGGRATSTFGGTVSKAGTVVSTMGGFLDKAAIAVGVLGAAFVTAQIAGQVFSSILEGSSEDVDSMTARIQGLQASLSTEGQTNTLLDPAVWVNANTGAQQFWSGTGEAITGWGDAMDLATTKGNVWLDNLLGLNTQYTIAAETISQTSDALAGLAASDFETASAGFRTIASDAIDAGASQKDLNDQFSSYRSELEKTASALGVTNLSTQDYINWMGGNVPPAIAEAVESFDGQKDSLAGIADETDRAADEAERLIDRTETLSGAYADSQESQYNYTEAQNALNEAIRKGTTSLDSNTDEGIANRRQLQKMKDAGDDLAVQQAITSESTDGMSDALWNNYSALYDTIYAMTDNEKQAREMTNAYYGVPDDVKTKAEFDNAYANGKIAETKKKIKNVPSEKETDMKVNKAQADKDIEDFSNKVDGATKDRTVWVKITGWIDKAFKSTLDKIPSGGNMGSPGSSSSINHDGGLMEFYANGGLRAMDPVAQMVPANTWRVVGDRGDVPEAYIPLDGSPRSWNILSETLKRMPTRMWHDGGIAAFAAGAVTVPTTASAVKTPGSGDMTAVAKAFDDLAKAMGSSWTTLLTGLLGQADAFYDDMLSSTLDYQKVTRSRQASHLSAMRAAIQAHQAWVLSSMTGFYASESRALGAHLSDQSSREAGFRATQRALTDNQERWLLSSASGFFGDQSTATGRFLSAQVSRHRNASEQLRSTWSRTWADMSDSSAAFRSREGDRFSSFLNGRMRGIQNSWARDTKRSWSSMWSEMVASATTIFGRLPSAVGNTLSSISSKMNTHIVNPYNKVVSDLDLKKDLKLSSFPTQKYAMGGMMPGYSPGRDVHKFYSPTAGLLELSGGEPVLRPEVGRVLGKDWVDSVNAAARRGGVPGVQGFLGGHQAHADGGFIQSLANGGTIKKNTAGLVELGKILQSMGVRVSEGPSPFGPVTPVHSKNSWHYRQGALDLNTAPGQSAKEMADFDRIMPLLYKLGWGVIWRYSGHYNHAHVDLGNRSLGSFNRNPNTSGDIWEQLMSYKVGPSTGGGSSTDFFDIKGKMGDWLKSADKAVDSGALPDLMMGVGDKIFTELASAKAGQFIEQPTFPGSTGAASDSSEKGRARGRSWATANGLSDREWKALDYIVTHESGWNAKAKNPVSTASGLGQFINATSRAYLGTAPASSVPFDRQLSGIISYTGDRYKGLVGAEEFWKRNHHYSKGTSGIDLNPEVLLRDGGGSLPRGYSVVQNDLRHEETILPKTTADVTRTFERLEQVTGGDGVTFKDSTFLSDPKQTAEEIYRMERMGRAAMSVQM